MKMNTAAAAAAAAFATNHRLRLKLVLVGAFLFQLHMLTIGSIDRVPPPIFLQKEPKVAFTSTTTAALSNRPIPKTKPKMITTAIAVCSSSIRS